MYGVELGPEIEGWYKDPYRRHTDRWFSNGTATSLVRDGQSVSRDEPPSEPFDSPLIESDEVPVTNETVRAGDEPAPESPNAFENVSGLTAMAWGASTRREPPPPFDW